MAEKRLHKDHCQIGEAFGQFYQTCRDKTVLDKRTSELIRLALACTLHCAPCTEEHIKGALDAGASKQEVAEALLLAAMESAGAQLNTTEEACFCWPAAHRKSDFEEGLKELSAWV